MSQPAQSPASISHATYYLTSITLEWSESFKSYMKVLGVRPGNDLTLHWTTFINIKHILSYTFCYCCNAGCCTGGWLPVDQPKTLVWKAVHSCQGRTVLQYKLYIKSFPITAGTSSTLFPYSPAWWILWPNLGADNWNSVSRDFVQCVNSMPRLFLNIGIGMNLSIHHHVKEAASSLQQEEPPYKPPLYTCGQAQLSS